MKISVVTTLYYSESYIEQFYNRIKKTLDALNITEYEFVFVNDGSADHSLSIAIELRKMDPVICIVDLARNFGHHRAALEGLRHSTGDLVYFSDCDLEEDPELIETFYKEWQKYHDTEEVDVIYGRQKNREGGFFRRISGRLFYSSLDFLSAERMPRDVSMTRLMTRRFVDNLLRFEEHNFYLDGLFQLTGFRQVSIEIPKTYKGTTRYTFLRRFDLAVEGLLSQSNRLLVVIFVLGLAILTFSVAYVMLLIYQYIVNTTTVDGWTSLMVSMWLLSGLVISSVGIVGLYVSKIFIETKHRPSTIIREIYPSE